MKKEEDPDVRAWSVLAIGGSDSGGGAGIQADIKTFSSLGVHGTSVITAVTAQNTRGVVDVFGMTPEQVSCQLDAVLGDFRIGWAKTGMLHSASIVRAVAERLRKSEVSLVLDPVMEAEAGGILLGRSSLDALRDELLPLASVVTPNIYEAEALTGIRVADMTSAEEAGRAILDMGARAVIITGGHLDCTDLLVGDDEVHCIAGPRSEGGNHGVGCTYSASLTAFLSIGKSIQDAAALAKSFAQASVASSVNVGHGVPPVDQAALIRQDADRFRVVSNLELAVSMLLNEPAILEMIPEVGMNIGMAAQDASSSMDVAAVEGRLVRAGSRIHRSGCIRFGISRHIARVILAAMRFDPGVRASMNMMLAEPALTSAESMGLEIGSFDRRDEPTGEKTMSWGISWAILERGSVPDLIWDGGGHGKEPMIRLLGTDAVAVASMAIKIARACSRSRNANQSYL